LSDGSLPHNGNSLGHAERFFLIVRDVDGRHGTPSVTCTFGRGLLANPPDLGAEFNTEFGVQIRERLVQQKHIRSHNQSACERDPLLLTTGELIGLTSGVLAHLDHLQGLGNPTIHFLGSHPSDREAEGNVRLDGHMRPQRVRLEHHAGVAFVRRELRDISGSGGVAECDRAGRRLNEPGDHAEKGGFPAAGRPKEKKEFSRFDAERNAIDSRA
jgi:hypothetical protein